MIRLGLEGLHPKFVRKCSPVVAAKSRTYHSKYYELLGLVDCSFQLIITLGLNHGPVLRDGVNNYDHKIAKTHLHRPEPYPRPPPQ